jgi:hypothetical protein
VGGTGAAPQVPIHVAAETGIEPIASDARQVRTDKRVGAIDATPGLGERSGA